MTANRQAGRRTFHLASLIGALLALTGCVADGSNGAGPHNSGQNFNNTGLSAAPAQPRRTTYKCGSDGTILVEASNNAVHLVDTEGTSYDLPASPPTQRNRFGEGSVALVVEEGEALWMKAGREPQTCRQ